MRSARAHRNTRSTLVVLAATATSLVGLALPARAADATVTDIGTLQTAAASCTDGDVVTIGADISATTEIITTGCTMTLDLNDRSLAVAQVVITPGTTLTITGGTTEAGELTAVATASRAAGIRTAGASLVIESGTITATGYRNPYDGLGQGGAGIGGSSTYDTMADAGTTTINGGTVTAKAGPDAAGIGGGPYGDGGITTINGGTVAATGSGMFDQGSGSGIGGGVVGNGGTTTINGGTVDVSGGIFAAGIGGGNGGNSGTTTIGSGAKVTTTGGVSGPGIGAGPRGNGGATVIEAGADVTAIGGIHQDGANDISGIGQTGYAADHPFGTLTVSGILRIPTGANLTVPTDGSATVTATGVITGSTDETDGGQIYGPGTIDNGGSIVLPDAQVIDASAPASVTDHHFAVSFDTQGGSAAPSPVTVFADSFSAGERAFPEPPTKSGVDFTGWNSEADGSGVPVDATSSLPGAATSGPLAVTAYAQYTTPPVVDPTPPAGPSPTITGLTPTISGTPRERGTLTARPGAVSPAGTTFTYQWLSDGTPIRGATAQSFTVGKKQAGHRVAVRITATSPGSPAVARTSARTRLVSSPYRRIVLNDRSIDRGQRFRVTATGFRPGQKIRIWLGGTKAASTRADSTGTVSRSVGFAGSIRLGTRRVRVSGYDATGTRTGTIHTTVRYRR